LRTPLNYGVLCVDTKTPVSGEKREKDFNGLKEEKKCLIDGCRDRGRVGHWAGNKSAFYYSTNIERTDASVN